MGVGAAAERAARSARSLDGTSVVEVPDPVAVAFDETDVVWLPAPVAPAAAVAEWVAGGGRLLATGGGAAVPAALGIGAPPAAVPVAPVAHAGAITLVGLGSHPIFRGLSDRASLPLHESDAASVLACEPGQGRVLARALDSAGLATGPGIAWEVPHGRGGVLAIGLPLEGSSTEDDAAVLLRNALLGDAIPHSDRPTTGPAWPRPAGVPREVDLRGIDLELAAAPPGELSPDAPSLPVESDAVRWIAGRRALVRGAAAGPMEVWTHPWRLGSAVTVLLDGSLVRPVRLRADAGVGMLERRVAAVGGEATETWWVALEHPVIAWEVETDRRDFELRWTCDLSLAGPYPAGVGGTIEYRIGADGRSLDLRTDGGLVAAAFRGDGGELAVDPAGDSALHLRFRGHGRARLVALAAAPEELATLAAELARRGLAGMREQRVRHSTQLRRYGTALETPDAELNAAFDRSRVAEESRLARAPATGRAMLGDPAAAAAPAIVTREAVAPAVGLLAAGHREPARELLRFLVRTLRPDGRVLARADTSGVGTPGDASTAAALLHLAAAYRAWTGDAALSDRDAAALDRVRALVRAAGEAAVGLPEPARAGRDPLAEDVEELWGARPDAPAGFLRLTPRCPDRWPRMALRRLRVGASALDFELVRRPGRVVVRAALVSGPPLTVEIGPARMPPSMVTLDEVELGGSRARFECTGRHEAVFHE